LKDPESEMARLTHNDYLEQASDSGFVGLILYAAFIWGSVILLYLRRHCDPLAFAIWLGLLAWSLQGFVEFGLYIPALAWPAFLFFGLLWGWTGGVNSDRHPQTPRLQSGPDK
jgi:O-antigen ligase